MAERFRGDFFDRFSIELADSDALLQESYRLRYRVYVDEMKFERKEDFPHGIEHDSYDPRALTVLLRHRTSGQCIGCVRLIVADPDDIAQPFPFELAAAGQIRSRSQVFRRTPRRRIGEVSRLAVTEAFRRRRVDDELGLGALEESGFYVDDPRRQNIPPALGLVFAAAWLGIEIGLEAVFVMMELRLARLLRHLGFKFKQVAEPIEYHGLRAPFEITSDSLLGDVAPHLRSALQLVREKSLALSSSLDTPLVRVAQPAY